MSTEEKLYLKCNLCNDSHHYTFSEEEVQGIEVEWKSSGIDSILLQNSPVIESEYIVRLEPPLTLDLNKCFWAIYLNPNASLNGIETEQDLIDITFCKCEIIEITEQLERTAFLKIVVKSVLTVDDFKKHRNPKSHWLTLLNDESTFKKYGFTENYSTFSYINIAVEGDLGISALIKKENGKSHIVTINEWDFHLDVWNLCSLALTKEDEEKYDIQHYL
ncbi:hypothetical protein [Tenacibaculum ovolyticum]|uniref:hypothetical protein n=1 Tax=Tenacibaculum ovolyticum TaxID=104270 RepID=UPI003BACDEDA